MTVVNFRLGSGNIIFKIEMIFATFAPRPGWYYRSKEEGETVKNKLMRRWRECFALFIALGLLAGTASASEKLDGRSLTKEVLEDIRKGKVEVEGDHAAVSALILKRDIPIPYEYIATLMRTPNAFGDGPACTLCHGSSDPARSYRGLDLTTCKGIIAGATEAPARKVVVAGKPKHGSIRQMLRNNRMPLGVSFAAPTDTPEIETIRKWIDDGAKDDATFNEKVLPLFKKEGAFGTPQACTDCHMSNQEPPSFHELDLTSHKGVMTGADSIANAKKGEPPAPIVVPGKASESALYQRLVENRMPPGIDPSEDRDHANTQILLRWVEQGAKCN